MLGSLSIATTTPRLPLWLMAVVVAPITGWPISLMCTWPGVTATPAGTDTISVRSGKVTPAAGRTDHACAPATGTDARSASAATASVAHAALLSSRRRSILTLHPVRRRDDAPAAA